MAWIVGIGRGGGDVDGHVMLTSTIDDRLQLPVAEQGDVVAEDAEPDVGRDIESDEACEDIWERQKGIIETGYPRIERGGSEVRVRELDLDEGSFHTLIVEALLKPVEADIINTVSRPSCTNRAKQLPRRARQ